MRPEKLFSPEAPKFALRALEGLHQPDKFEPRVGFELRTIKFLAEELKKKRMKDQGEGQKDGEEEWKEPEVDEVGEDEWTEIRDRCFKKHTRVRQLKRLWEKRG